MVGVGDLPAEGQPPVPLQGSRQGVHVDHHLDGVVGAGPAALRVNDGNPVPALGDQVGCVMLNSSQRLSLFVLFISGHDGIGQFAKHGLGPATHLWLRVLEEPAYWLFVEGVVVSS